MAVNAALAYHDNSVKTASKADLTLMLYEGAIRFCNFALVAMENGDLAKASENIVKTENIITEFRATLDENYPVSEDFRRIYDIIYFKLTEANVQKDPELLEEALGYIREMRDIWKEIMRLNKAKGA